MDEILIGHESKLIKNKVFFALKLSVAVFTLPINAISDHLELFVYQCRMCDIHGQFHPDVIISRHTEIQL